MLSPPSTQSSETSSQVSIERYCSVVDIERSKFNKDTYLSYSLGICCENMCMFNSNSHEVIAPKDLYRRALDQIRDCQRRLMHLSKRERYNFIRNEVDKAFKGVTLGGHIILELTVVPGGPIVCNQAFRNIYDIGYTTFKKICKEVKSRSVSSAAILTTRSIRNESLKRRDATKDYFCIPDTDELLAMEYCPDTPMAMQTYVWMKQYFEVMGEMMPVGWGQRKEIHLDSGTLKSEVWTEYKYVCRLLIILLPLRISYLQKRIQ